MSRENLIIARIRQLERQRKELELVIEWLTVARVKNKKKFEKSRCYDQRRSKKMKSRCCV